MRTALTFKNSRRDVPVPMHYNYPLASYIYRTIRMSSKQYAEHLHQQGYSFHGKYFSTRQALAESGIPGLQP